MATYLNEELENLYLLMKALKRGDKAQIAQLRQKTGVQDDFETLTATLRFMQIGMAPTYEFAKAMYAQEQDLIIKARQNRNTARLIYEHIEGEHQRSAQRAWAKESTRASLDERLDESRQDLKDAQTYHDIYTK